MDQVKYIYGVNQFFQPAGLSAEQVKSQLESVFPELSRADIVRNDDGSVEFVVRAANKGSDQVRYVYGNNTVYRSADVPAETVKSDLETIFPELSRADIIRNDDGSVEFVVRAANKGA